MSSCLECKRICKRLKCIEIVFDTLKDGISSIPDQSLLVPLESFQSLVEDLEPFLNNNLEPTSFSNLCKPSYRLHYCDAIGEFNKRFNSLLLEISGILLIQPESIFGLSAITRRQEDFEDLKSSFANSMELFQKKFSIQEAKDDHILDREATLDLIVMQESLIQSTLISIHGPSNALTTEELQDLSSHIEVATKNAHQKSFN
jgi:hypothetical protein